MSKTEILIAGSNPGGPETITNLFTNHPEWVLTEAHSDEEAIEKFHRNNFDVVILSDALSIKEEKKLRKIFAIQSPEIIIAKHTNDNKGLLIAEITSALDKARKVRKPSISLVDDALVNAGLNIIVE